MFGKNLWPNPLDLDTPVSFLVKLKGSKVASGKINR